MNGAHSPSLLRLENVGRSYDTATVEVEALVAVNLTIDHGEHVAVVGRSGAGKSTLLNVLGLLEVPTSGSYWVGDVDTASCNERDRTALRAATFGFVFQSFHLIGTHTVRENVELGLVYARPRIARRASVIEATLEQVGLGHRIDALASTLSGGEQQRAAIARAIVASPPVLLCDEPTGNLDSQTAAVILDLLEELNRVSGVTLVVVTHDAQVAQRARRTVVVDDGRVTHGASA